MLYLSSFFGTELRINMRKWISVQVGTRENMSLPNTLELMSRYTEKLECGTKNNKFKSVMRKQGNKENHVIVQMTCPYLKCNKPSNSNAL